MAFGYRYKIERQENGWWLVRFPEVPEALTEGETEEEARAAALDCLIAALEGYIQAGRPIPKPSPPDAAANCVTIPSVYENLRAHGRSKVKVANELDALLAKLRRELTIESGVRESY